MIRRTFFAVATMSLMMNAHAGKDPIGWSISGSLPATAQINHSYAVNFTLVNNLPFTMPSPLEIANNSTPTADFTMEDNCSGLRLAQGQTCNVGVVMIPKSAGQKSLSVFMEYGKNKVQIPVTALKSTVPGSSAPSLLSGAVTTGFPTGLHSNTTYTITFTFTNNTSGTLNVNLAQNPGNTAGYTQTFTNCSSTLLPGADNACVVTGTFTTAATSGAVTEGYTMTSGSLSADATTSSVINNSSSSAVRTITFVNNCGQNVWFGIVGGAVSAAPCNNTTNVCPYGSTCNTAANNGAGECFYNAPAPADGNYLLTASGGTKTVQVVDNGLQYVWSGNMAARTANAPAGFPCATGACATADCTGGTGGNKACPPGSGFNQPASLAEITMQRGTIDSYDISILNGTNVPVEMTPSSTLPFNPSGQQPSEYNCTSPGKPTQTNGLGNCPWTFTPPANFPVAGSSYKYRYVTPTSNPGCTDATSCPGGTVCGLYFNKSGSPVTLNSYCGTLLGYNTPNQVCSYANTHMTLPVSGTANVGNPYFNCDSASGVTSAGGTGSPTTGTAYTLWALYACKAQPNADLGTCYNTSANPPASTTNCCGCVNWQTYGSGIVVPSSTTTCEKFNTSWTSGANSVLDGISWMKLGCPTAYAYPFDDKSSGFGCMDINSTGHTVNTVNYTVTFCPS